MPPRKGFTLVEFMVSVAVLAILSATAIPNFNYFIVKTRVDNEITELYRLLLLTRNTAINTGYEVTLCPLDDANKCSIDWQQTLSVFIDANDNKAKDDDEKIIKIKNPITEGDKLQYALGRYRLVYAPTGRTVKWGSNGTFKYCPESLTDLSRGVVVATSGRIYVSSDIDNDGKDENRSGKEIICR